MLHIFSPLLLQNINDGCSGPLEQGTELESHSDFSILIILVYFNLYFC